jgi:hypothetical protein
VREESHLDDMRAAIRGDFERLERRRGAQELMHVTEREDEQEPASDHRLEPERQPGHELVVEAEAPEPQAEPGPALDLEQTEAAEAAQPPARSWLARLLAAIPPRQV